MDNQRPQARSFHSY